LGNPKVQDPNPNKTPNVKSQNDAHSKATRDLRVGFWDLFGVWSLGFGIFKRFF
jgi:hypothetical protein